VKGNFLTAARKDPVRSLVGNSLTGRELNRPPFPRRDESIGLRSGLASAGNSLTGINFSGSGRSIANGSHKGGRRGRRGACRRVEKRTGEIKGARAKPRSLNPRHLFSTSSLSSPALACSSVYLVRCTPQRVISGNA